MNARNGTGTDGRDVSFPTRRSVLTRAEQHESNLDGPGLDRLIAAIVAKPVSTEFEPAKRRDRSYPRLAKRGVDYIPLRFAQPPTEQPKLRLVRE